jgi:4-oxalocrotonate tautomerase
MPVLRVSMWSGKTREEKAALARALTEAMTATADVPAQAVTIQFEELPRENWATGGRLHDELFKE